MVWAILPLLTVLALDPRMADPKGNKLGASAYRRPSDMTMESVVGPDVKAALVAKEKFVARLRSVDPTLIVDFEEFLFDYGAPRRTLQAEFARVPREFGEKDE